MQNVKRLSKKEKAVSTVIGNILMVVITVVIAALLFVWVMSFTSNLELPDVLKPLFGNSDNEKEKGKINIDFSVAKKDGDYTVTIEYISKDVSIDEIRYYVKDNSDNTVEYGYVSDILEKESGNVTFYDNDDNWKISKNDKFIIKSEIVEDGTILKLKHAEFGNGQVKLS